MEALKEELINFLPGSYSAQRKLWAQRLIEPGENLEDLLVLLTAEKKISTRFAWLLGEVAELKPSILYTVLPKILSMRNNIAHVNLEYCFSRWWYLCGIPEQNEGEATELLFSWLVSAESLVSVKVYSMYALQQVCAKYPELKDELKLSIENLHHTSTPAIKVATRKVLKNIAV